MSDVLEKIPQCILVICNKDGTILKSVSPNSLDLPAPLLEPNSFIDFFQPVAREQISIKYNTLIQPGGGAQQLYSEQKSYTAFLTKQDIAEQEHHLWLIFPENKETEERCFSHYSAKELLNEAPAGLFVTDHQGNFRFVNQKWLEFTGIDTSAALGKGWLQSIHPDDLEVLQNNWNYYLAKNSEWGLEHRFLHKMGMETWVWSQSRPLFDHRNRFFGYLGICQDITAQKKGEENFQKVIQRLKKAQQVASIGHWYLDIQKNELEWSDEVFRLFGLQKQEFEPTYHSFLHYIHPEDREAVHNAYSQSLTQKSNYQIRHRIITKNQEVRYVEEACVHEKDENGEIIASIGTVKDISETILFERELKLAYMVFQNIHDSIVITDHTLKITDVNQAFTKLSGYSRQEILGETPRILKSGWHDTAFYAQMWQEINEKGYWLGEVRDRRKNGSIYIAEISITSVKDETGNLSNYIAISNDVTDRREKEKRINQLAYYDILTNLPNRILLQERVEQRIYGAAKQDQKFAILFLDLDNFKVVNDSLGHFAGDQFLREISSRIQKILYRSDIVSRISGDEFIILLDLIHKPEDAIKVARKIIQELSEPAFILNKTLQSSVSIGISIYPDDGLDYETLIRNADSAMYYVKQRGKNSYQFFREEMNQKAKERLNLEIHLRKAIKEGGFSLAFQPKVSLKERKIIGFEVLLRFENGESNIISPSIFIPLLEELNLIQEVGRWVLKQACILGKPIIDKYPGLSMSVNVSGLQLENSIFIAQVESIINETNFPPSLLDLEITESIALSSINQVHERMQEIAQMGIHISIDDFGTGYSSLYQISNLHANSLKIDRSFIRELTYNKKSAIVTKTIINLSKELKLFTIAEGAESLEEIHILQELQCDAVQGYFFSKPLSYDGLITFIDSFSWPIG